MSSADWESPNQKMREEGAAWLVGFKGELEKEFMGKFEMFFVCKFYVLSHILNCIS